MTRINEEIVPADRDRQGKREESIQIEETESHSLAGVKCLECHCIGTIMKSENEVFLRPDIVRKTLPGLKKGMIRNLHRIPPTMKSAFEEVRTEVSKLNSFVQERISGIKEIQIFNREEVEQNSFIKINEKHKNAWLKTVWYNSIFFPIAEISTSITIGLLVWFGGRLVGVEFSGVTIGTIFLFIQLSQMLFRPLMQIADKFNTLQN